MARTSEETLSTRRDRLFSLARYISPSNSSRTGQKSFSKASRLENICISPGPQDAMQLSNERLTTADSRRTGCLIDARESELPRQMNWGRECLQQRGAAANVTPIRFFWIHVRFNFRANLRS